MATNLEYLAIATVMVFLLAAAYVMMIKPVWKIPAEDYCQQDSDCACGRNTANGNCFYGNALYVNTAEQCPDYCSGLADNLEIKCVSNQCVQLPKNIK
ncbi:MAG: hypothetical protein V1492_05750 [Candidatus Micrarchaeota archaeon]